MMNYEGWQFAQYILYQLVGQGGFADVYKAWDDHLSRWVAIKILHKDLSSREVEQFLKEAQIMANLKHPHIITVFAYDYVQVVELKRFHTVPYYVMEYASHGSLAERHPHGERLPMDVIIQYFSQIVAALEYIHDIRQDDLRLVHLDMKPSNILVGGKDEILISDFGIAKFVQNTYEHTVSTQRGTLLGTPTYMAPERFRGQLCLASDQYALGIMLYKWLTGRYPFHGSDSEIIQQQLYTLPPSLRAISPYISPAIERVVLKALRKNPYSRFTNVRELYTALEDAMHSSFPSSLFSFLRGSY